MAIPEQTRRMWVANLSRHRITLIELQKVLVGNIYMEQAHKCAKMIEIIDEVLEFLKNEPDTLKMYIR